jgi:spoIIIJ-associated protein
MDSWNQLLTTTLERMGFRDFKVDFDPEHRHGSVFIYDNPALIKENLPVFVDSLNHLVQLIAQKNKEDSLFIDINNYRREREGLIVELARAAARKALATKESIPLPAMNSYERRIVHVELAAHPEVQTESRDEGKDRYVVVKPILE